MIVCNKLTQTINKMKQATSNIKDSAIKIFITLLVLSSLQLMAQKAPPEFSVHAGGGIATYCFQPISKEVSSLGYNWDLGAGFTGFVSRQVGIHIGAGIGQFDVKSKVKQLNTVTLNIQDPDFTDPRAEYYDLYTTLNDYNEIHKSFFINIPVMLQFQSRQREYWSWKNTQKAGFYAMGGAKLFFLLSNKYEVRVPTMYNKAYFPELADTEHGAWLDGPPYKGFGTFDGNTKNGTLDFAVLVTFSLELGVKWRIDNNMFIYTGAFFDCGLFDPIKDSRKPYENYTKPEDLKDNLTILKFSDKANLMTVGIKLRLAFTRPQRPY